MSVNRFDPAAERETQTQISLSAPAQAHIESQLEHSGHRHIRLGVEESGCNGYKYRLDYIDAPEADDRAFAGGQHWQLYVRRLDVPFVSGTEIVLQEDGLNRSLRFKNPNADSHCGCGESFSVSDSAATD